MHKLVVVCACSFGFAVTLWGGEAAAQSTSNCIAMGPTMIHCDTTDTGSNDSSQPRDGAIGRIGRYIANAREDALRKRVGKLLADGDCQGAARMALEDGALELGQSISSTCHQPQPIAALASPVAPAPGALALADCTPEKIAYAQSVGVDCHSLGARWP